LKREKSNNIRLTLTLSREIYELLEEEVKKRFGNRRGGKQFFIEELLRSYFKKPSPMER